MHPFYLKPWTSGSLYIVDGVAIFLVMVLSYDDPSTRGTVSLGTVAVCSEFQAKADAEERVLLEERQKAQAMATALATIGKFIIKKKARSPWLVPQPPPPPPPSPGDAMSQAGRYQWSRAMTTPWHVIFTLFSRLP